MSKCEMLDPARVVILGSWPWSRKNDRVYITGEISDSMHDVTTWREQTVTLVDERFHGLVGLQAQQYPRNLHE